MFSLQSNALGLFPDTDTFIFRALPGSAQPSGQPTDFSLHLLSLEPSAAVAAADTNDTLPEQSNKPAAVRSLWAAEGLFGGCSGARTAMEIMELFTSLSPGGISEDEQQEQGDRTAELPANRSKLSSSCRAFLNRNFTILQKQFKTGMS